MNSTLETIMAISVLLMVNALTVMACYVMYKIIKDK